MSERRSLLMGLGVLVGSALATAIVVPATVFLRFPTRRRTVSGGDEPIEVARLVELTDGVPKRVAVRAARLRDAWNAFTDVTLGTAWLVRSGAEVRALSSVCPHAGCAVGYRDEERCFRCPCHDSAFSLDGARRSGPTPRGLDALDCTVENGRVRLTWKRFRQGVAGKEPT